MAKQVVSEVRKNGFVEIVLSYEFDKDLVGKKEREEVVVGNVTKYWVYVPNVVAPGEPIKFIRGAKQTAKKAAKKALRIKLEQEKLERMNRYAAQIAKWEDIQPTKEDYVSGRALQSVCLRAQKKELCKLA